MAQPSSCNGDTTNFPKTFLDGVKHGSVPKKLRSAIKKRGRESITLPIAKKKHHTSNGVDTLRKDGIKKSKLNKRKGHITKDEEEVAQTLYALAGMFTDAKEADQPRLDHEQPETTLEEGDSINAAEGEEYRKTCSKVTIEAAGSHSSTADVVKSQPLGAQQPEMEPATPSAAGVQYGMDDKCKDKFLSSATGAPSSETQKSCCALVNSRLCNARFPAWFESSIISSQPRVTENSTEKVQHGPASVESKNSWKRCTAHVYISRLIKVMQISQTKESLPEKPTQLTALINGASSSGIQKDSSEKQNDIVLHKRPVQDQQMATDTSAFKQGYDFLSLGTGESVNKAGGVRYQTTYVQSQDRSAMLFPLPQNGHSSTFNTHNAAFPTQQVPQYQSSFTAQTGQQLAAQLQTHYNNRSGVREDSASVLNYAHALFPHLNAALAAKYQQFLPSQHQLLPLMPLKRHQHLLPLGFERNPENMTHLQLHHLRNR